MPTNVVPPDGYVVAKPWRSEDNFTVIFADDLIQPIGEDPIEVPKYGSFHYFYALVREGAAHFRPAVARRVNAIENAMREIFVARGKRKTLAWFEHKYETDWEVQKLMASYYGPHKRKYVYVQYYADECMIQAAGA